MRHAKMEADHVAQAPLHGIEECFFEREAVNGHHDGYAALKDPVDVSSTASTIGAIAFPEAVDTEAIPADLGLGAFNTGHLDNLDIAEEGGTILGQPRTSNFFRMPLQKKFDGIKPSLEGCRFSHIIPIQNVNANYSY